MDDRLFGVIARLPPQKFDLLVGGVGEFYESLNGMRRASVNAPEPFRSELRRVLDPRQYEGLTSWGPLCKRCGHCCFTITQNPQLFDGMIDDHGGCLHFDHERRLCKVYERRPLMCRVDDLYDALYTGVCTRAEYYAAQAASCLLIRTLAKVAP